jgi:large subunit ribosomal protein L21
LSEAGIATFESLANAKVEEIEKILTDAGLRMMDATTWPQQAELAAQGDWESLKKLQDSLSGGRKASAQKKSAAKKTSKK